jgi:4-amino-4-deoxy-L-arabinose transferase-like glycosyltransferase
MSLIDLPYLRDWISRRLPFANNNLVGKRSWDRVAVARLFAMILIMGLAVGLRVWDLGQVGFNTDEAVYSGQAAAIAGAPILKDIFPIFRAHPLLFHVILSLVFHYGVSDVAGRLAAVAIGLATVYFAYLLGSLLYGKNAGILAALILAIMPYHVVVSRQVLLDGPMVFFSTLTLYLLARFANTGRSAWLHAVGVGMGLTFLAKETGIILLAAIYAFLALSREIRIRIIDLIISTALVGLIVAPYPLSLMLAGGTRSGQQYLVWQLFRRANHPWNFYLLTVPPVIGILVIVIGLFGLWLLRKENTWRERLLLCWILVPVIFFDLWPTKGFQYLLPIAPPFAVLAARTLVRWHPVEDIRFLGRRLNIALIKAVILAITVLTLLIPSLQSIRPATTGTFIAGTGGVPGGREAGLWIRDHIPTGATLLTIGPSMANILEFYGYRQAYGLSISPNPLRRNPSYQAIVNPDLQIRNGDLQYVVWDSYSAERSSFFSNGLLKFTKRYHGRIIYVESVMVPSPDGTTVAKPVIIIYEVRP